jgi:hypothetical protein
MYSTVVECTTQNNEHTVTSEGDDVCVFSSVDRYINVPVSRDLLLVLYSTGPVQFRFSWVCLHSPFSMKTEQRL